MSHTGKPNKGLEILSNKLRTSVRDNPRGRFGIALQCLSVQSAQQQSLPVMEELRSYVLDLVASGRYEANSNMGKAVSYFNKHWEGLTGFCRWENAKLDNNPMERALRTVVLGRKNFYFYQSTTGARVSDIVTSLIATCKLNDINPLVYLTGISSHHEAVKKSPGQWLPWNYPKT